MNSVVTDKRTMLTRIVSLEAVMAAFGIYSLITGFLEMKELQIFWGVMILGGLGALFAVRRRDWKKHWEELDAIAVERSRATLPAQRSCID